MQPTSLTVNSRPIKAYEDNGLVYPVAPIQELIRLEIKNLNADMVKSIQLSEYLSVDLMAFLVKVDFRSDDSTSLRDGQETRIVTPNVVVDMLFKSVINQGLGDSFNTTEKMRLTHGGYLNPIEGLLFKQDQTLQIKADTELASLTYYCHPVYQHSVININVPNVTQVDPNT